MEKKGLFLLNTPKPDSLNFTIFMKSQDEGLFSLSESG